LPAFEPVSPPQELGQLETVASLQTRLKHHEPSQRHAQTPSHNLCARDFLSLFQTNTDATNTQTNPYPQNTAWKQVVTELQKHTHYNNQKEKYRGE
jgi:hypothetical protein